MGVPVPAGLSEREAEIYRRAFLDARRHLGGGGVDDVASRSGGGSMYGGAGRMGGGGRYDGPSGMGGGSRYDDYAMGAPPRASAYQPDPLPAAPPPPLPPAPSSSLLPCKYSKLAQGGGHLILPQPVSKWTEIPLNSFRDGAVARSMIDQWTSTVAPMASSSSPPRATTPTTAAQTKQQDGVAGLLSLTAALAAAEERDGDGGGGWSTAGGAVNGLAARGGMGSERKQAAEPRYQSLVAAASVYKGGGW